MSTKRIPLSASNPNVANSPMRALAGINGLKKGRLHADTVREEPYGQPPPAKRQMIERGVASPSRPKTRTIVHRAAGAATRTTASTATTQRASVASLIPATEEELANLRTWHNQIRSRFPKMVFYFEGIIEDELRAKLAKKIGRLGAVSLPDRAVAILICQTDHPYVVARGEVFLYQHHPRRHEPAHPTRENQGRTRRRDGSPRRQRAAQDD